jgi:hypothetical protein
MAAVFDLAKTRIGNKRDQVEDALRDRVDKFEKKVRKKLTFTIKNNVLTLEEYYFL